MLPSSVDALIQEDVAVRSETFELIGNPDVVQLDGKTQVNRNDFRSYKADGIDYTQGQPYKSGFKAGSKELADACRAADVRTTGYKITKMGAVCRKCSIDEVSQFLNVLIGQIPLRILKTRPELSEESMVAFALPAKISTNSNCGISAGQSYGLRYRGDAANYFDNFIAWYGEIRKVFAKLAFRVDFSHRDLRWAALCSGPSI